MSRVLRLQVERALGSLLLAAAASSLYGQSGDSLTQKLENQFTLTKLTSDGSDIAAAGAVLALQKKGLWMYSTASKLPPLNTYKNGRMSKSVGRDMAIAMQTPGDHGFVDLPKRSFAAGEKCWIIGLGIEKDGIVFRLYSDPYNNLRYYGDLKFSFEKGSVPTPNQASTMIAEVLAVQPANSPNVAEQSAVDPTSGKATGSPLHTPATYVSAQTPADQLHLNADNSLSLQEAGRTYRGTFLVVGDTLKISIPEIDTTTTMTIQGSNLSDPGGQTWALREQSASASSNASALRNEDVMKMAKAGLGDEIIIAKIKSSTCQFDTAPDTLIQLKQSGVSATILRAMTEAAH